MNIFVVVTNGEGNVIVHKTIATEDFKRFEKLYEKVSSERHALEDQYPEPKFTIHIGVGDSLVSVLRSFPEIQHPKITA